MRNVPDRRTAREAGFGKFITDCNTNFMQEQLTPDFGDYELLDTGDFEKLERFGRYVTRRPEPQAI